MAGASRRLGRGRFDLTIDLQGLLALGADGRGDRARRCAWGWPMPARGPWFYTHHVDAPRLGMHAVDRVLRVAGRSAPMTRGLVSTCRSAEEDRRWAAGVARGLPRPRIMLNLGAQWLTKRWPPRTFRRDRPAGGRRATVRA